MGANSVVPSSQSVRLLFQCAALLRWDPARMAELLGLGPSAVEELDGLAAPVGLAGDAVEDALVSVFGATAV